MRMSLTDFWLLLLLIAALLGARQGLGAGATQPATVDVQKLQTSAASGDATAQNRLGLCYERGTGVAVDLVEAAKWYRKAAEQGHAKAQYNLSRRLDATSTLDSLDKLDESVKWLRKAADQGVAAAQLEVNAPFVEGFPAAVGSKAEAVKMWHAAAEQGYPPAEDRLALLYDVGKATNGCVERDPAEAMKWARKGAERGNHMSQLILAGLYRDGDGVAKNPVEALKWHSLAKGHDKFWQEHILPLREGEMSAEDVKKSKQLVAEFKAKETPPPDPDLSLPPYEPNSSDMDRQSR